jgi:hypothetical protein
MGYLSVKGKLLTYVEYKAYCEQYKLDGLRQFLHIYSAHKDRYIESHNLHWGEEIEYTLYYIDAHA